MNELPTLFEIVTEKKPIKDKPAQDSGSKSRGSLKVEPWKIFISDIDENDALLQFYISYKIFYLTDFCFAEVK